MWISWCRRAPPSRGAGHHVSPGIPIRVAMSPLITSCRKAPLWFRSDRECLERAARLPEEAVVVPSDLLIYMKLHAGRAKDIAAVVDS